MNIIVQLNFYLFLSIPIINVNGCTEIHPDGCFDHPQKQITEGSETESEITDDFIQIQCIDANLSGIPTSFCDPKYLRISENSIEILDIILYDNLTFLYLNNNKIKYIKSNSFQQLSNLKILDLTFNDISSINKQTFTGLTKLNNLILDHNPLYYIDALTFSCLKNLQFLQLSFCHILKLDPFVFNELNSLIEINLSHNELSKIDSIGKMDNLKVLNLSYNSIHEMDCKTLEKLPRLENLNLEDNQLKHVIDLRYLNLSLTMLNLRKNIIFELDSFELYSLHKLTYLDLSYTHLSTVDKNNLPDELFQSDNGKLLLWDIPLDCNDCNNLWMTTNKVVLANNEQKLLICKEKTKEGDHETLRSGMEHCLNSSTKASKVAIIAFAFLASIAVIMLMVVIVRQKKRRRRSPNSSALSQEIQYREMEDNAPFTIDDCNENNTDKIGNGNI